LDPFGSDWFAQSTAVSRRFVTGTQKRLADLMRRDLSKVDMAVLMIDGAHFVNHVGRARAPTISRSMI